MLCWVKLQAKFAWVGKKLGVEILVATGAGPWIALPVRRCWCRCASPSDADFGTTSWEERPSPRQPPGQTTAISITSSRRTESLHSPCLHTGARLALCSCVRATEIVHAQVWGSREQSSDRRKQEPHGRPAIRPSPRSLTLRRLSTEHTSKSQPPMLFRADITW